MAGETRNKTNSDEKQLDELLNSITNELNKTRHICEKHANYKAPYLLYRINPQIRLLDPHSYNPCVVSIGPYHHGYMKLNAMERDKLKCVRFVIEYNSERRLSDYLSAIREVSQQARSYYHEEILMEIQDFEKMLLLDGCFLLVSLYGITGVPDQSTAENLNLESYLTNPERQIGRWQANFANRDILLTENQIPFFVIEKIYEVLAGRVAVQALRKEIAKYMERVLHIFPKAIHESNRPMDFHHLLHLCHMYFKPSQSFGEMYSYVTRSNDHDAKSLLNRQPMKWRRAIEYHEAGIEFKLKVYNKHKPHSLLDIEFRRGVIEIPYFLVDDSTVPLFKNLVAFEQSSLQFDHDVAAFIFFISELVRGSDDVKLLTQCGIISHPMHGERDVATIFSRLSKGVVFDVDGNYYLKRLCHLMETHFQQQATLKKHWLWRCGSKNNSMRCLVAITMVIIVLFTIFRAIVSIITYLKPPPVIIITGN